MVYMVKKNQNGRSGKDKIIEVPLGTLLLDEQTQEEICETLTPTRILTKGSEGWCRFPFEPRIDSTMQTNLKKAPLIADPGL